MRWLLFDGLDELWLWRREWDPPEGLTRVHVDRAVAADAVRQCASSASAMRRLRALLVDQGVPSDLRWMPDAAVVAEVGRHVEAGRLVVGLRHIRHGTATVEQPPEVARPRAASSARSELEQVLRSAPAGTEAPAPAAPPAQPAAPPAGTRVPPAGALEPPIGDEILSTYEFVLLDERDDGISGVPIQLRTPGGLWVIPTGGGGSASTNQEPPGIGIGRVSDRSALTAALLSLVERPMRRIPLPEGDDPVVVPPWEADTAFTFPDGTPKRVMVVSRMDLVWGLGGEHWGSYALDEASAARSRLYPEGDVTTLHLASAGDGASVTIHTPRLMPPEAPAPMLPPLPAINTRWLGLDIYVWQPGDTLPDIAFRYLHDGSRWGELWELNQAQYPDREPGALSPGEFLTMPSGSMPSYLSALPPGPWPSPAPSDAARRFSVDVDALHAQLRAADFAGVEAFTDHARSAPPPPPSAEWPLPLGEAVLFRNTMIELENEGVADFGGAVDEALSR